MVWERLEKVYKDFSKIHLLENGSICILWFLCEYLEYLEASTYTECWNFSEICLASTFLENMFLGKKLPLPPNIYKNKNLDSTEFCLKDWFISTWLSCDAFLSSNVCAKHLKQNVLFVQVLIYLYFYSNVCLFVSLCNKLTVINTDRYVDVLVGIPEIWALCCLQCYL